LTHCQCRPLNDKNMLHKIKKYYTYNNFFFFFKKKLKNQGVHCNFLNFCKQLIFFFFFGIYKNTLVLFKKNNNNKELFVFLKRKIGQSISQPPNPLQ
jgi:hypothetical protein